MPRLRANGIDLEYEAIGDPKAPPLLLVMGLGAQLITWDDSFCTQLAGRGFQVIRYDNRDAGLSTKMEAAGIPDVRAAFMGDPQPAYTLDDLADDAVGLLDGLGIRAAHVVGASMGGFIAQLIAINHPDRVLSLTSIMSGPGGRDAVAPWPEGAEVLTRVPDPTRDDRIEHGVWVSRVLVGRGNPFDEAKERARSTRAVDRSYYPLGFGRQLVAILAAGSRIEKLRGIEVPTLVVHGIDDPLLPVENGRRVAAAVPGARLLEFEGMGHNIPERYWPPILDAIAETARQASIAQPS